MDNASPARLYCALVGARARGRRDHRLLLRVELRTGNSIQADDVFGVLAVNGWHNLVHIGVGLVADRLREPATRADGRLGVGAALPRARDLGLPRHRRTASATSSTSSRSTPRTTSCT